jgi:hypothetical protein
LFDENFKYFHKQDIEKKNILEKILLNCRGEFLKEILLDNFYKFRKDYVIEYILQVIEFYEIDKKLEEDEIIKYSLLIKLRDTFNTIIQMDLYKKEVDDIFAFFLSFFSIYEPFR